MSADYDASWLESLDLTGPAKTFAQFCATELDRRSGTDEDFDSEIYEEAVKLVLRKLGALDMEGMQ